MKRTTTALMLLAAFGTSGLAAQAALPLNATTPGSTSGDNAAEYVFSASAAGFLTVIVRTPTSDGDLVLSVADDQYQTLAGGRSDQDLHGVFGAEQVTVNVPGPGSYLVLVDGAYSTSRIDFEIGATFLATDLAGGTMDADGRPDGATALEVGGMHEDEIDPAAGDHRDWYRLTAGAAGVMTILTRAADAEEGDVKLELFMDGMFREPDQTSDQDQSGVMTNETVTVDVTAGQTVYVRVSPAFEGGSRAAYRITAGLIPS